MGGGEGNLSAANGQLAAAVEAEPTKPEQSGAEQDLGHVMGRTDRLGPLAPGANQTSQHQCRDTGADVHHGATGEVQVFAEEAAAPDHVGQRGINQEQPDRREQAPEAEADALHQGA